MTLKSIKILPVNIVLPHVQHFANFLTSNLSKCQIWFAFPFVSKIASLSGSVKKVGVEELKQLAGDCWYLWLNVKPSSDLMRKTSTNIGFDSRIQICLQFCFCFLRIVMKVAAASGVLLRPQQWIFFQFMLQGSNLSFYHVFPCNWCTETSQDRLWILFPQRSFFCLTVFAPSDYFHSIAPLARPLMLHSLFSFMTTVSID